MNEFQLFLIITLLAVAFGGWQYARMLGQEAEEVDDLLDKVFKDYDDALAALATQEEENDWVKDREAIRNARYGKSDHA